MINANAVWLAFWIIISSLVGFCFGFYTGWTEHRNHEDEET